MNLRTDNNLLRNEYINKLFGQEDVTLQNTRASIAESQKHMCLSAFEAQIIEVLIKVGGFKKIVEIGTLSGYTSIRMARAAGEGAKIYTLEKSPESAANARKNIANSDVSERIEVIEGDAHAELEKLSAQAPFDMVFIDADKNGYTKYLDWAEKNVRKNGLIIGDNTFLFGGVYNPSEAEEMPSKMIETMSNFNERLADKSKFSGAILPTDEGMTIAVKEF